MNIDLEGTKDWLDRARNADWKAGELAKRCGVSLRTLQRFFIQKFGTTPKVWLFQQRQMEAANQLQRGRWIKETAIDLGYNHQTQFSREFKKHWGYPPSLHKQQNGARKPSSS